MLLHHVYPMSFPRSAKSLKWKRENCVSQSRTHEQRQMIACMLLAIAWSWLHSFGHFLCATNWKYKEGHSKRKVQVITSHTCFLPPHLGRELATPCFIFLHLASPCFTLLHLCAISRAVNTWFVNILMSFSNNAWSIRGCDDCDNEKSSAQPHCALDLS